MSPPIFVARLLSARDAPTSFTLSRGPSIGLVLDMEAGLLSCVAASVILILIYRRIRRKKTWDGIDIYIISLFTAEVIQGLGHAMDMKWVIEGQLHTGTFCSAQGVMRQLGGVAAALTTTAIAVQTFVTIWWLKDPSKTIAVVSIVVQWLFAILFVTISYALHTHPGKEYFATPTPFWCWIGQGFATERIAGQYFWFWLTLLISIILYLLLLLWYLGFIKEGGSRFAPTKGEPESEDEHQRNSLEVNERGSSRSAHSLAVEPTVEFRTTSSKVWTTIAYPGVYCLMILPLSIVRWIGFRQEATVGHSHIPPWATFFGGILFALSGVWNTILYLQTRAIVILGDDDD